MRLVAALVVIDWLGEVVASQDEVACSAASREQHLFKNAVRNQVISKHG